MTLEQLRIFVAVAEREHVTEAAQALHLTQSAVSAAIRALEARTATALFDRIGRRIALSEAGKLFLIEARAVLARAAAAETVLADLAGLKRGHLRIAASQTVANYWLPPLLCRYRRSHPGIALDLFIGNSEEVRARLRDGLDDFGFVEDAIDDPHLTVTPVAEDELIVVAAGPIKVRTLTPAAIKTMPWVFRESGSGTRAIFEAALRREGIKPGDLEIVLELPSNEAVRAAAEAGAGAAALSKLVVAGALKRGALKALAWKRPTRRFFALRLKERGITRAEAAFYALVRGCKVA
jgi:DNA-binding transcriptional LysR family regulator